MASAHSPSIIFVQQKTPGKVIYFNHAFGKFHRPLFQSPQELWSPCLVWKNTMQLVNTECSTDLSHFTYINNQPCELTGVFLLCFPFLWKKISIVWCSVFLHKRTDCIDNVVKMSILKHNTPCKIHFCDSEHPWIVLDGLSTKGKHQEKSLWSLPAIYLYLCALLSNKTWTGSQHVQAHTNVKRKFHGSKVFMGCSCWGLEKIIQAQHQRNRAEGTINATWDEFCMFFVVCCPRVLTFNTGWESWQLKMKDKRSEWQRNWSKSVSNMSLLGKCWLGACWRLMKLCVVYEHAPKTNTEAVHICWENTFVE